MDLSDVIISQTYVEEKNYTEEEIVRMGYERSYPDDWVDDTITINKFDLSEMRVNPEQEKKNGGTYYSSKCILVCYSDEREVQIPFFIENFKNYNEDTDTLVVSGKNVLARLIRKIGDEENRKNTRFELKFDSFREYVNGTEDVQISIEEYVKNGGYTDYTIR